MFRKPRVLVLAAVALYAIALCIAWQQVDDRADRRVETMLKAAETGFSDVINGEVEAALRNVGGAVIHIFGGKCRHVSIERMRELARTFNIDELNIVDRRGIVVASNIKKIIGTDFHEEPKTREFLELLDSKTTVSQPFRQSVDNPNAFCKYYGMAFSNHCGFVQLGMAVERLRQNMYSYTSEEADRILRNWHFSVVGWYERANDTPHFKAGEMISRFDEKSGEMLIGRYFAYNDYKYLALLPESYCYSQRNAAFAVTALVLGTFLFLFTYFIVRLVMASDKLERMYALANARNAADLALARTIQMSALPTANGAFMECMEFSLSAECCPAREVGGDFYDFFHVSGDRLAFLVADVSGKGIPGALFMMEAKNVIKSCLGTFSDLAEAVAEANRRLCANNKAELFVTAWIGILDRTGTFEYVNAGHNRPFVRRANGEVEKVMGRGGRFLGIFEDATYRINTLKLSKGDFFFLYTDGITEAMNEGGEQFGERRLVAEIKDCNRHLHEVLAAFVGRAERSDDQTGLQISWYGSPETSERTFPCTGESLGAVIGFLRSTLAAVDKNAVAALLNVADEIMSNIVGYSGAQDCTVTVERGQDRLRLVFSDTGKPYNPLMHADPDTHAAIQDRPVGGLGLVVVKRLADRVTYLREDGRNVLTVIKRC